MTTFASKFENATVVVVHGAWADGSSWETVIRPLQEKGLNVVAAPIPLTSLSDDAAALKRTIARTQGPLILAGHAYAGAVIATANDERVKALVYVAALAPDEGETVAEVFYRDEPHPEAPQLAPDQDGFIWMPDSGFDHAFAQNATAEQIALSKADRVAEYSGKGSSSGVEVEANLVPSRGAGSNDQSQNSTLYGGAYEGHGAVLSR
jgi:pimeloyl-ACP methyl ester carboxylesterase